MKSDFVRRARNKRRRIVKRHKAKRKAGSRNRVKQRQYEMRWKAEAKLQAVQNLYHALQSQLKMAAGSKALSLEIGN
jgi:parvulin-like peptidyl-prolyl isomerase